MTGTDGKIRLYGVYSAMRGGFAREWMWSGKLVIGFEESYEFL